jgi:hypothetical protein
LVSIHDSTRIAREGVTSHERKNLFLDLRQRVTFSMAHAGQFHTTKEQRKLAGGDLRLA